MEKCKNTPEVHPGLLVGCVGLGVQDYPVTKEFSVPIKDRRVVITGCRLCTESPDLDYEIMFELLGDDGGFQTDAYGITVRLNEVEKYLAGINPLTLI